MLAMRELWKNQRDRRLGSAELIYVMSLVGVSMLFGRLTLTRGMLPQVLYW
jgi:hypothetical protein